MTYVNGGSVMGIGVLFIVLGTLAIAARIFVRLKTCRPGLDDWFSLAAWVLVMGECSIMIAGSATHTIGSHSPAGIGSAILYYDGWDQMLLERFEWPFDVIQVITLATLKLSVLLFYRRLFVSRAFKICSAILIGIVVLWAVVFVICLCAQCGTNIIANFQTLGDLKAKCIDTFAILIGLAASDVAVDLVILSIPVPMILSLQLPLKKRVGILLVLLAGALATGCGIVRLYFFCETLGPSLFSKPTVGGVSSTDDIGIVSILMFWGMLEMGIAMVTICLPVLYRLLRDWSPLGLFEQLRSWGTRKTVNSSTSDDTKIVDEDAGKRHTREISQDTNGGWSATSQAGYMASCSPRSSGELGTESQKGLVREGEIWEHTRITQISNAV